MKWLFLIAAVLGILVDAGFLIRWIIKGFPRKVSYLPLLAILTIISGIAIAGAHGVLTCHLDGLWTYTIGFISLDDKLTIKDIKDKCRRDLLEKDNRFSYVLGIPIAMSGITTFPAGAKLWVMLLDNFGGYYVQNPPVSITGERWRATNIRPLREIAEILFVKAGPGCDADLRAKVDEGIRTGKWPSFPRLKTDCEVVGSIELE